MKTGFRFIAVFVPVLFVLSFLVPGGSTQTNSEETAGQRFKNIKVLNDMPADQLGKVMNLMSASLGVGCSHCHVGDDFAREGKKEKDVSRQMIRMTFGLNKDNFGGRTEITCNTCHRGGTHPRSAINLDPAPAAPGGTGSTLTGAPGVDEILEKYTRAIGGRGNLAKITSRRISAHRIEPNGTIEPEEVWQKGDKFLLTTLYPGVVVTQAFDGAKAWKRAGDFDVALKADEAEQIRRNAQFFSSADLKTVYPKMEFRSAELINGRRAYLLEATTAQNSRERLYFDAEDGFLIRRTAAVATVLGEFEYRVDYADYRDAGGGFGVKLPATIRHVVPNITWTQKIISVENNAPVDESKFKRR